MADSRTETKKGGLLALERRLFALEQLDGVSVGWQGQSGGAKHPSGGGTVAGIAAILEFGSEPHGSHPGTHEYAPLRNAAENGRRTLAIAGSIAIGAVIDGSTSPEQAMSDIGETFARMVGREFDQSASLQPANAEATVRDKGQNSPMRDTLTVRNAISYAVGDDSETVVR